MGCRALNHGNVRSGFPKRGTNIVGGIVRADHNGFLVLVSVRPWMLRRMVLIALENVHAFELRHIGLGRHSRRKYELFWLGDDFLAVALHDNGPFAALLVVRRLLAFG